MASSSSTSTSMSSLSDSGEQRAQRSSLSTPPLHYHHQQRTSSMAQQQHHHTHSSPLAQHQLTSAQYHDELERLHSPLLGDAPQQHPGGLQLPLGIPAPLSQQQQQQQQMMHHHHHQQQTQQQQHYGQAQRQNSGIVPQQHHHHHQQQQQQHYGAQQQLQAVKQPPFGEQDMDEDQLGGEKEENVKREGGLREPTGTTCPEFSFNLQGLYPAELREDGVRFSVMYQVHYVRIFEEADAVRLDGVREAVTSFWPKTRRFFSLFQSPIIVHQIVNIDYMLYDALVNMLVPDPFRCVAPEVSSAIIELSRQFPAWLHNAIQFAIPLALTDAKIRAVKYFCKTLHKRAMISNLGGRLTNHLNGLHLTPEKRQRWSSQLQQQQQHGTHEDSADMSSLSRRRMLQDWMGLDFAFIAAQTSLFDTPDRPYSVPLPSTLLQDITQLLAHEAGVEQWSEWLHGSILANHIFAGERKESSAKAQGDLIHDFVLKWSFFSANVQQELTSMRAETLKMFRLLFEWVEAVLNHHMELSWKNRGPADAMSAMSHQAMAPSGGPPQSVVGSPSLMRRRPSPPDMTGASGSADHFHTVGAAPPAAQHPYGASPFSSPAASPVMSSMPGSPLQSRTAAGGPAGVVAGGGGVSGAESPQAMQSRLYMQSLHNQQQKQNAALAAQQQQSVAYQQMGFPVGPQQGAQPGFWPQQGFAPMAGPGGGYYVPANAAPQYGYLPKESTQALKQQVDFLSHKMSEGRAPHTRAHRKHSNSFNAGSPPAGVSFTVTPPTTPPAPGQGQGQQVSAAQPSRVGSHPIQPTQQQQQQMPMAAAPYPLKAIQTRPRSLSQPVGLAQPVMMMNGQPGGGGMHPPSMVATTPQRPATFEDASGGGGGGGNGGVGASVPASGYRPLIPSPLAQHSLSPRSPQGQQPNTLPRQQPQSQPQQQHGGQGAHMRSSGDSMDYAGMDGSGGGGEASYAAMMAATAGGGSSTMGGQQGSNASPQQIRRTLSK